MSTMQDTPNIPQNDIPDELVIVLRRPVELGGKGTAPPEVLVELNLREPTLIELEDLTKNSTKHGVIAAIKMLIATQTGASAAAVGRIGARDFKQAEKYLSSFFDDSPKTGETS